MVCDKCDGPDVVDRWKAFINEPRIKLLLAEVTHR